MVLVYWFLSDKLNRIFCLWRTQTDIKRQLNYDMYCFVVPAYFHWNLQKHDKIGQKISHGVSLMWLHTHFVDAKLSSHLVSFWQWESFPFSILRQPRAVAGFRGTVRYASINAHRNRVSSLICIRSISWSWKQSVMPLLLNSFFVFLRVYLLCTNWCLQIWGKGSILHCSSCCKGNSGYLWCSVLL